MRVTVLCRFESGQPPKPMRCETCEEGLAEYQCPICNRWVCNECWDFMDDCCSECVREKAEADLVEVMVKLRPLGVMKG